MDHSVCKKHLIEGLISLGLISNSKFMAILSDWMGAMAVLGGSMAGSPLPPLGSATEDQDRRL